MELLSKFLVRASASNAEPSDVVMSLKCDSCGCDVDENEMQEGQCEDCYSDYSGPKYCCGVIYEAGEDTCKSCGESL